MNFLSDLAVEALNVESKFKPCYTGVVTGLDQAKTTAFILSGETILLAFHPAGRVLKPGDVVTFVISGQRAEHIQVEQ
jgi:plastocyanin